MRQFLGLMHYILIHYILAQVRAARRSEYGSFVAVRFLRQNIVYLTAACAIAAAAVAWYLSRLSAFLSVVIQPQRAMGVYLCVIQRERNGFPVFWETHYSKRQAEIAAMTWRRAGYYAHAIRWC